MVETLSPIISTSDFKDWIRQQRDPFETSLLAAHGPYLAIEEFREADPEKHFSGNEVARKFRSSGTTSSDRSTALFSARGLELYRRASLLTFFTAITRATRSDPFTLQGVSYIPPVNVWPDSSLAQMVAWIAEVVPVTYLPEGAPLPQFNQPIWLFGTAFHHILAIDQGLVRQSLPSGSLVIETGGTKGRTRSLEREDLYKLCADAYGVPVISEYGMCELASQAYDWGEGFRFPYWVKIAAVQGINLVTSIGQGMLLVHDSKRIDYPLGIRTEDIVEIDTDRSFKLVGRARRAPLRGCSLNIEEVTNKSATNFSNVIETIDVPSRLTILERATKIAIKVTDFLSDERSLESLTKELGSTNAAKQALEDLSRGLPLSNDEWAEAALNAASLQPRLPRHWVFLLPRNHSLVIAYPLALAKLLGLTVSVRIPAELASPNGFAHRYATCLNATILSSDRQLPTSDAVLCYGSDETVGLIRQQANCFVRTYGNNVSIVVASLNELATAADLIARDTLATAQRGCLAPRLFILRKGIDTSLVEVATIILKAVREFWGLPSSPEERLGWEREYHRLKRLGFSCFGGQEDDNGLIAIQESITENLEINLIESACARHPMTFPILLVAEPDPRHFVKTITEIFQKKSSQGLSLVRELGHANAPKWDGFHLGVPLFAD